MEMLSLFSSGQTSALVLSCVTSKSQTSFQMKENVDEVIGTANTNYITNVNSSTAFISEDKCFFFFFTFKKPYPKELRSNIPVVFSLLFFIILFLKLFYSF